MVSDFGCASVHLLDVLACGTHGDARQHLGVVQAGAASEREKVGRQVDGGSFKNGIKRLSPYSVHTSL